MSTRLAFRDEQVETIEEIAEAFREGRPRYSRGMNRLSFVDLPHFAGAVPLLDEAGMPAFGKDDALAFTDATPECLGHVNVCCASVVLDDPNRGLCSLFRLRRLTRESAKRVPGAQPGMYEFSSGILARKREPLLAFRLLFRWHDPGLTSLELRQGLGFVPVHKHLFTQDDERFYRRRAQVALGFAVTLHYEWRVELAYDGAPAVGVATTLEGVRELFRLRERNPATNRRDALRHWVRGHARARAGGALSEVREHLRGKVAFEWNGLAARVKQSHYDMERAALTASAGK